MVKKLPMVILAGLALVYSGASNAVEHLSIDGANYDFYPEFSVSRDMVQNVPNEALGLWAGHPVLASQGKKLPHGVIGFIVPNDRRQGAVLTGRFLIRCAPEEMKCLEKFQNMSGVNVRMIDDEHALGELSVKDLDAWKAVNGKLQENSEVYAHVIRGIDHGRVLKKRDAGLLPKGDAFSLDKKKSLIEQLFQDESKSTKSADSAEK